MYLLPYLSELSPTKQFWSLVKGKIKPSRLTTEKALSSRVVDACNDRVNDLNGLCSHFKRQIINSCA
jgi:hypothetical protein